MPEPLAVEEHRRFVLLALADDDDAIHLDGVQDEAHRIDRCLIGRDLLAAAHPPTGRQRRGLGHAHQVEGKVSIGQLSHRESPLIPIVR